MNTDDMILNEHYITLDKNNKPELMLTKIDTSTNGYKYFVTFRRITDPDKESTGYYIDNDTHEKIHTQPDYNYVLIENKFYREEMNDVFNMILYKRPHERYAIECATKYGYYHDMIPAIHKMVSDMDVDEVGYWAGGGMWVCESPPLGSITIRMLKKYDNGDFDVSYNGAIYEIRSGKFEYGPSTAFMQSVAKTVEDARNLNSKIGWYA